MRRDSCRFFSTAFSLYAFCQQELIVTLIISLKIVDVSKVATWYKRIGKPSTEHFMESWDRCTVETRFRLGCFQQSSRPRRSTSQDAGARKRPPRPVETGDVWHRSLRPNEIKDSNFMTYECSSSNPKSTIQRNQPTIPWFDDVYNSNFQHITGNFQASTGEHLMAPAIPWISVFRILMVMTWFQLVEQNGVLQTGGCFFLKMVWYLAVGFCSSNL